MAKGYWVAHNIVKDVTAYEAYKTAAAPALKEFAAKFVIRGGTQENPEGTLKPRTIVIEFPSYQAALDCYNSDTYQTAVGIRRPLADGDLVIVEGFDG